MRRDLSELELRGFHAAVAKRSLGEANLGFASLDVTSAAQIWSMVTTAYPLPVLADVSRCLSGRELAVFKQSLAVESAGKVSCSVKVLRVDRALALWAIACAVEAGRPVSVRGSGLPWRLAGAAMLALPLAACATLGSNINGSFSCEAPGGTCAPSTVIDDQALSMIQNARPMTPAGPYMQQGTSLGAKVIAASSRSQGRILSMGDGVAHRDRRVVKVVFPSYVDRRGYLHEARTIQAVADNGGWMQVSQGELNAGEAAVGQTRAIEGAHYAPPVQPIVDIGMNTPAELSGWALQGRATLGPPTVMGPTPDLAAVAAARARVGQPKLPTSVGEIKAAVDAKLGVAPSAEQSSLTGEPLVGVASSPASSTGAKSPQLASGLGAPNPTVSPNVVVGNKPASFPGKVE